jgi:hypothetical protein
VGPRRRRNRLRADPARPPRGGALRERFANLGAACACPAPPAGGYATPALFALRQPPRLTRTAPELPDAAALAADPHDASAVEIQQRLVRIEALLEELRIAECGLRNE